MNSDLLPKWSSESDLWEGTEGGIISSCFRSLDFSQRKLKRPCFGPWRHGNRSLIHLPPTAKYMWENDVPPHPEVTHHGLVREKPSRTTRFVSCINGSPGSREGRNSFHICVASSFPTTYCFYFYWWYCLRLRSNLIHEHSPGNLSGRFLSEDYISILEWIENKRLEFGTELRLVCRGIQWVVCGVLLPLLSATCRV